MSTKTTWADVAAWAKREIEAARTNLETATATELPAIQARIAVMRELQKLNDIPKATEMPPSVSY